MRKSKVEDAAIKGMLEDEYKRCQELIEQVNKSLSKYPRGQIVQKKVKSKDRIYNYHHLQWRQGAKVLSRHVPEKEIAEMKNMISLREAYRSSCIKLVNRLEYLAALLGKTKPSRRSLLNAHISAAPEKNPSNNIEQSDGGAPRARQVKKVKSG